MGKSHLTPCTHYLSIAMAHRGPEVYVVSVCHASVSRMDLKSPCTGENDPMGSSIEK